MTIRMLHSVGPRMQATKWWYKWWAPWAKHINWVRLSDSDTIPWLGWWENLQKAAQNLVVKPRLCCKCSLRSIHKLIWQKSTKNHGQKAWHCLDHVHSIDHKSWFHPPLNFSVNDVYMAMVSKFVDPKKWMASVRKAQVYACGSYMDRCFTSNINLSNGPVAFSENMLPFPPPKKTWETQWFIIHHGLVGGIPTPLKNMSSWVGIMTFPIYGKSWNSCSKPPTSSITISFPRFKVYHVGEMAKKISSAGTWTIQKTLVFLRSWRLSSCKPTGKWLIPKNNWAISIHIYTLVIVSDW